MDVFLPKGFEPGLNRASFSEPRRQAQLSVEAGGVHYPVLRRWAAGFAVSAGDVPALDGVVDLYEGAEHLGQCLIKGRETVGEERVFTVKRAATLDYAAASEIDNAVLAARFSEM